MKGGNGVNYSTETPVAGACDTIDLDEGYAFQDIVGLIIVLIVIVFLCCIFNGGLFGGARY